MYEGLPFGESPVDIEPPTLETPPRPGLRWTIAVLVTGNVALALLNTHAITNWANQQPVSQANAPILNAAQGWHDAAAKLGLDQPVAHGRALWKAIKGEQNEAPPPH